MKKILLAFLFISIKSFAQQKDYVLKAVPFTSVKLTDQLGEMTVWFPATIKDVEIITY